MKKCAYYQYSIQKYKSNQNEISVHTYINMALTVEQKTDLVEDVNQLEKLNSPGGV